MKFWYILMAVSFTLMFLFATGLDDPSGHAWILHLILVALSFGVAYYCQKKIEEFD